MMLIEMSKEEATVLVSWITEEIKRLSESQVGPEIIVLDAVRGRMREMLSTADRSHFEKWLHGQSKKLEDMRKEGEQLRLPIRQ